MLVRRPPIVVPLDLLEMGPRNRIGVRVGDGEGGVGLVFGGFTGAHGSGVSHGRFVCFGDGVVGHLVFGGYVSRAFGCVDVERVGGGVSSVRVGMIGGKWA